MELVKGALELRTVMVEIKIKNKSIAHKITHQPIDEEQNGRQNNLAQLKDSLAKKLFKIFLLTNHSR